MRNKTIWGALAVGFAVGCGANFEDEQQWQQFSQELSLYNFDASRWDSDNGGIVPICFIGGSSGLRQELEDVIEDTWGQHTGMSFDWLGTCSMDPTAATIPVRINDTLGNGCGFWGGVAQPWGIGARLSSSDCSGGQICQIRQDYPNPTAGSCSAMDYLRVLDTFVHEVGHALGMAHEHEREDRDICPEQSGSSTNPQRWLTIYDPDSVMNYCPRDDSLIMQLSQLDKVGAEMLYPKSFSRRLVVQGAFANSSGSVYIARKDDTYSVVPHHINQGALPGVYYNSWVWRINGTVIGSPLVMTRQFTSSVALRLDFTDIFSRNHNEIVSVTSDNSKFTAVLMSVL